MLPLFLDRFLLALEGVKKTIAGRRRLPDMACLSGKPGEADDGSRTRDLRLGKPTLYQLSYVRAGRILDALGV